MTTPSSEINDLFLMRIKDYRLDTIFANSGSVILNAYLEPWLMDASVEFDICNQDLTYVATSGSVEGYFVETLTLENKIVLSQLMVKYWLAKSISDVLQFSNFITDRDFRSFSSAQNLMAKQKYYSLKVEELSQLLMNYGYKKNSWINWKAQNFDA